MIFVTVGTQIPFDRLMQMVDQVAPQLDGEEIVAQSCAGVYEPSHFKTLQFIEPAEFERIMDTARLVVAHAGIGTILAAMRRGKPLVVVPRQAALREHRNDHQIATAQMLAARSGVAVAHDAAELLQHMLDTPVPAHLSEHPSPSLISALRSAIDA